MDKPMDEETLSKIKEYVNGCPVFHTRRAVRGFTRSMDELLQPTGIRVTQQHILVTIAIADPPTLTHVADELVMDRTTFTRNLRPLEKRGLIRVFPGEDRRTRVLQLTPEGQRVMLSALEIITATGPSLEAEVGQQTVRDLHRNLSALEAAFALATTA